MSEAELPKLPKLPGKAAPKPKGGSAKSPAAPNPKSDNPPKNESPEPKSPDPNDLPDPVIPEEVAPETRRVIEDTAEQAAQETADELVDPTSPLPEPGDLEPPPDFQIDPATLEDPAGLLTAFGDGSKTDDVWTPPDQQDAANAADEPDMPGFDPDSLPDPALDDQNGPELTISGHHRQRRQQATTQALEVAEFPGGGDDSSGGDESAIEILKKLRDDFQEVKQKLENGDYFRLQ